MRGNKEDARERNPGIEISPSSAFFLLAQQGKQHRMGGFSFPNVQFWPSGALWPLARHQGCLQWWTLRCSWGNPAGCEKPSQLS